jgi:hypothetical protein
LSEAPTERHDLCGLIPKEAMKMNFYQRQHAFYCGVDLHARTKGSSSGVPVSGTERPRPLSGRLGQRQNDRWAATGCWEWFRKDGTKLRSGAFLNGEQVGERTTYDNAGKVHKVTVMKPKKTGCKK